MFKIVLRYSKEEKTEGGDKMAEQDYKDKVLEFRAKHNMSMEQFAKLSNLTSQTVWGIETGIQTPSRLTKAKIDLAIKSYEEENK